MISLALSLTPESRNAGPHPTITGAGFRNAHLSFLLQPFQRQHQQSPLLPHPPLAPTSGEPLEVWRGASPPRSPPVYSISYFPSAFGSTCPLPNMEPEGALDPCWGKGGDEGKLGLGS